MGSYGTRSRAHASASGLLAKETGTLTLKCAAASASTKNQLKVSTGTWLAASRRYAQSASQLTATKPTSMKQQAPAAALS